MSIVCPKIGVIYLLLSNWSETPATAWKFFLLLHIILLFLYNTIKKVKFITREPALSLNLTVKLSCEDPFNHFNYAIQSLHIKFIFRHVFGGPFFYTEKHCNGQTILISLTQLTAAEVTDDFENKRSASLNFLFLLSALLFVFLKETNIELMKM